MDQIRRVSSFLVKRFFDKIVRLVTILLPKMEAIVSPTMYTCGICVEDFPEEGVVKHCEGKHVFCHQCMDDWIEKMFGKNEDGGEGGAGAGGGAEAGGDGPPTNRYTEHEGEKDDHNLKGIRNLLYLQEATCPLCREKISIVDPIVAEKGFRNAREFTGTIVKYWCNSIYIENKNKNGKIKPDPDAIGENGLIKKMEATYLNGKKHGPYRMWSPVGKPRIVCEFVNGRFHGTFTNYLYDHGRKNSEVEYVDGLKNGPYRNWFFNGNLKREGQFIHGKEDGEWTEWHDSGKRGKPVKKMEAFYVAGLKEGLWREWRPDGTLYFESNYQGGLTHGEEKRYHPDGVTMKVLEIHNRGLPLLHKSWWPNGNPECEYGYLGGMMHGPYQLWWETGQIKVSRGYKNGDHHGLFQMWAKNGIIHKEYHYHDDELHGLYQEWDSATGKLLKKMTYCEGRIDLVYVVREDGTEVTLKYADMIDPILKMHLQEDDP